MKLTGMKLRGEHWSWAEIRRALLQRWRAFGCTCTKHVGAVMLGRNDHFSDCPRRRRWFGRTPR